MIIERNNRYYLLIILVILLSCNDNPYKSGGEWYGAYCASCHGQDGSGFEELYPPLSGIINENYPIDDIACFVRYGKSSGSHYGSIEYDIAMPAYPEISNTNLVNLINYMNYEWGDKTSTSQERVNAKLDECKDKME